MHVRSPEATEPPVHPSHPGILGVLRRTFAPPSFEGDQRRSDVALLLHRGLLVYALGGSALFSVHIFRGTFRSGTVASVLLASIFVVVWALARLAKGHLRQSAGMALAANWSGTTAALFAMGTIRAPTFIFYLLAIHGAGLVFGSRGLIAMAGLCSATVGALVAAESGGFIAPPTLHVDAMNWMTANLALLTVGLLTLFHFETAQAALGRARREVVERRNAERDLVRLNSELSEAIERVRTLEGMLPVCSWCRRIRDDDDHWRELEVFVAERTGAAFEEGLCPDCAPREKA